MKVTIRASISLMLGDIILKIMIKNFDDVYTRVLLTLWTPLTETPPVDAINERGLVCKIGSWFLKQLLSGTCTIKYVVCLSLRAVPSAIIECSHLALKLAYNYLLLLL